MSETPKRPVFAFRVPLRGARGGTTVARYIYGRAVNRGSACDAADFDRRDEGFSKWFKERVPNPALWYSSGMRSDGWQRCIMPEAKKTTLVKDGITACFEGMAAAQRSLVMDFAGGDGAALEWASGNSLSDAAEASGIGVLAFAPVGPGIQDIDGVMRFVRSKLFLPHELLLICNGGLLGEDDDESKAFSDFLPPLKGEDDKRNPDIKAIVKDGAAVAFMPRIPAWDELERQRLDFFAAADPASTSLGIMRRLNLRTWLGGNAARSLPGMSQLFAHVAERLP